MNAKRTKNSEKVRERTPETEGTAVYHGDKVALPAEVIEEVIYEENGKQIIAVITNDGRVLEEDHKNAAQIRGAAFQKFENDTFAFDSESLYRHSPVKIGFGIELSGKSGERLVRAIEAFTEEAARVGRAPDDLLTHFVKALQTVQAHDVARAQPQKRGPYRKRSEIGPDEPKRDSRRKSAVMTRFQPAVVDVIDQARGDMDRNIWLERAALLMAGLQGISTDQSDDTPAEPLPPLAADRSFEGG